MRPVASVIALLGTLLVLAAPAAAAPQGDPVRLWSVSKVEQGDGVVPVRDGAQAGGKVIEYVPAALEVRLLARALDRTPAARCVHRGRTGCCGRLWVAPIISRAGERSRMSGRTAQRDPRFELRLEAKPAAVAKIRRQLAAFAAKYAVEESVDLALAVSEAVSNAVLHAYRGGETGLVRVVACVRASELVVVVRDYGCGMRPHPGSPGAGLGLSIIGAAASEMRVERPDDGGTRIRLRFRRDSRVAA